MDLSSILNSSARIEKVEWVLLPGERWREIGCNARKGWHGKVYMNEVARVTIEGITGFGWSRITKSQASHWIGKPVRHIFSSNGRINEEFRSLEYPLLDWLGKVTGKPVYDIISGEKLITQLQVPIYESTLYFDELHLSNQVEAIKFMQERALDGWNMGHRSFKIKVGRGARHMPLMEGINRDIAVINGIREAVGSSAHIMIDANNSYNLNITKQVLAETAHSNLTFIEEPFYEDPILLEDLHEWMNLHKIHVMIADGEGLTAAPALVDWAKKGLIDMIQYDIRFYGFNKLLELEDELKGTRVKQAPHNYGGPFGNYASAHIACYMDKFTFIEWDEVHVPGVCTSGYEIKEGKVLVPDLPGFGLVLDDPYFKKKVCDEGWAVR
ncbi:enolase C-terminal domain-like protein [Ammoniphilus sp. CFH 90114]|uniref:enolase C-terminal domain-like protein n=1 Tax=Ammoniphilus sp. CFH 90114 TaxID=2493665 RepID=UPI00100E4E24|nr:enolase C-terminal domain-like protein [Ammoniphilus sp. CFH 90114]RXT13979.1 mandelate racemase [Ammoniphilus sp. CFH 90114]